MTNAMKYQSGVIGTVVAHARNNSTGNSTTHYFGSVEEMNRAQDRWGNRKTIETAYVKTGKFESEQIIGEPDEDDMVKPMPIFR